MLSLGVDVDPFMNSAYSNFVLASTQYNLLVSSLVQSIQVLPVLLDFAIPHDCADSYCFLLKLLGSLPKFRSVRVYHHVMSVRSRSEKFPICVGSKPVNDLC